MFEKLKKFGFFFFLFVGVFSTTVFADVNTRSHVALDGKSYTYFYKITGYDSTGSYAFHYSDSPIKFEIKNEALYRVGECSGYESYYNSDGSLRRKGSFSGARAVVNIESGCSVKINGVDVGGIIPPVIAPTVGEAIQGIVPRLSKQLKNLLPVGVILLSTMLGVSLVRRLVRLFL